MGNLENRVDTAVDNALTQAGVQSDDAGSSNLLDLASSARSALTKIGEQVNERSEALSEDPRYAAEKAERDHRRRAIDNAFAAMDESTAVDQAYRNSKPARDELVARHGPGAVNRSIQWWRHFKDEFETNPDKLAVADKLARAALEMRPRLGKAEKSGDGLPSADDRSFSACFDRAEAELADRDARVELQEPLATFGPRFGSIVEEILGADNELAVDPVGFAVKTAATFGAPITPTHQAEVKQQQQTAQANAQMVEGFQRVIDSGLMPGFERPEIQDAVADVLSDPAFQRTGDNGRDLWNAYQTALRVQEAARNEQLKQRSAQRAKLSVGSSGAPVESGRSEASSTRQALDRAFASMGM